MMQEKGSGMTQKEKIWYLINGVISGSYEVNIFCDEFVRIYGLETDYTRLTEQETHKFKELFEMASRFSEYEEDLKIPNMYFSGEEVLQKAKEVQKTKCWKAHFKDAKHDEDIEILNTEEDSRKGPLRFEVDGIRFCARDISCIYLAEETQYPEAAEKFCILKLGGNSREGRKSPYWYELQRYELEVEIPICLVRKADDSEVRGALHLAYKYAECENEKVRILYRCDDVEVSHDEVQVSDFSISVDGNTYQCDEKTLFFWRALNNISIKMKENYYIKSCFTCQYSEYSPYGEDYYGTMLCYRGCKQECLKVQNKDDYFEYLDGKDCDVRQETYLCAEYEIRNKASGYRGFVEGVNI